MEPSSNLNQKTAIQVSTSGLTSNDTLNDKYNVITKKIVKMTNSRDRGHWPINQNK